MRRLAISLTLIVCSLLAGKSNSQDLQSMSYPEEAIASLRKSHLPTIAKSIDQISHDWSFITDNFEKVGVPTEDYQRSMAQNQALLATAGEMPDDPVSATVVGDVAEDLSAKAEHIMDVSTTIAGATAAAYSEVDISIRTVHGSTEVNGYLIGFSPRHLAGSDSLFRFNNPTSPSVGKLPPGRYEMTAMLNGQVVQRQEVSIGILGQGPEIVCLVP